MGVPKILLHRLVSLVGWVPLSNSYLLVLTYYVSYIHINDEISDSDFMDQVQKCIAILSESQECMSMIVRMEKMEME